MPNLSPVPQFDFSLRQFNTFGIDAKAHAYVQVSSLEELAAFKRNTKLKYLSHLILGGGSNILLTKDFPGLVLHMRMEGVEITGEDAEFTYVRAAAGENWHRFVRWTLSQGLAGLENLSLIPGSVGAAPIQNIGAYGVELKDYLHSVSIFDVETGAISMLDNPACEFGYRDSIFKGALRGRIIISSVLFALPKKWRPSMHYADVAQELERRRIAVPNAMDVSDAVIAIRTRKLPDPALVGNAGSFFKNPIVSAAQCDALLAHHSGLVRYPQQDGGVKLAAGWLIDQCGWKGRRIGPAGVYEKQALVLVNHGDATGQDIVRLSEMIQSDVFQRFGVMLEPEPVFI